MVCGSLFSQRRCAYSSAGFVNRPVVTTIPRLGPLNSNVAIARRVPLTTSSISTSRPSSAVRSTCRQYWNYYALQRLMPDLLNAGSGHADSPTNRSLPQTTPLTTGHANSPPQPNDQHNTIQTTEHDHGHRPQTETNTAHPSPVQTLVYKTQHPRSNAVLSTVQARNNLSPYKQCIDALRHDQEYRTRNQILLFQNSTSSQTSDPTK